MKHPVFAIVLLVSSSLAAENTAPDPAAGSALRFKALIYL